MAEFTLELRQVVSLKADLRLNEYPIWDPDTKTVTTGECQRRTDLNNKIVQHFWFREIGAETVEQWTWFLHRKMNEIMPLYNKLYETESLKIDPLSTMNYMEVSTSKGTVHDTGTNDNETATSNTTESAQRAVQSETPQVPLSGNEDYATSANDVTGNTTVGGNVTAKGTTESDSASTADGNRTVSGYQGHSAELLMRWRQSFLNIDLLVIEELEPLFMLLYNNNANYSTNNYLTFGFGPTGAMTNGGIA